MPSDQTSQALFDIRDNILLARDFVAGFSAQSFEEDRRTFYAVTRCLEIVSEATRRLSPEVRERHPQLPWRAIMGVGNIYRHNYDNVLESYVWDTVQNSLGPLLEMVEHELSTRP